MSRGEDIECVDVVGVVDRDDRTDRGDRESSASDIRESGLDRVICADLPEFSVGKLCVLSPRSVTKVEGAVSECAVCGRWALGE